MSNRPEGSGWYLDNAGKWNKQHSTRIPEELWDWLEKRMEITRRSGNAEIIHLLEFARRTIDLMDKNTADQLIRHLSTT